MFSCVRTSVVAALLFVLTGIVSAQTPIIGTFTLGGTPIANGTLSFILQNCGLTPSSGSSEYNATLSTAGVLSIPVQGNPGNGCTLSGGVNVSYFKITLTASTGVLIWQRNYQIPVQTTPFDLSTAQSMSTLPPPLSNGTQGPPGIPGSAASVTIGDVTTGNPGDPAQVTNTGTDSQAILNFVIPKGADGTGGGTPPAGAPLHLQINNAAGTALDATNYATDSTTKSDLLGIRNFTTGTIGNSNPNLQVTIAPSISSATDYIRRNADGTNAGGVFADASPFHINQEVNQRFACCDSAVPLVVNLDINSGYENVESNFQNYGLLALTYTGHTAVQGGGAWGYSVLAHGMGDTVGTTNTLFGSGITRGFDEGLEPHREFSAFAGGIFGGQAALLGPDPVGNQMMQLSNPSAFGYDLSSSAEQRLLIDVSAKWQAGTYSGTTLVTPGSTTGPVGTSFPDEPDFFEISADTASGLDAKFGASTMTFLTLPVDSELYTGTCPNVVDSGQSVPSGDAFITDPNGVPQTPSSANFCTTVGSTAGLTPGTLIAIAEGSFNFEYTTVIAVPDAHHFTAAMRHPHVTGSMVSWGGGVGYGWSSPADDRVPHTEDSVQNTQSAENILVYPIVATLPGNKMVLYVNDYVTHNAELKTHSPIWNTPIAPATISAPVVVGGVLTSFTSNGDSDNYHVPFGVADSGHPQFLTPPPVTFGGSSACATNPVIGWTRTLPSPISTGYGYTPYVVSGGSGCPSDLTVNVSATVPQPFNIYPITWTYRVKDPTTGSANTGFVRTEPLATGVWHNNDQVMQSMWWNRYMGSYDKLSGDDIVGNSQRTGIVKEEFFRDTQSGQALHAIINETPSWKYLGTEANNWVPSGIDSQLSTPTAHEVMGVYGAGVLFDTPPIIQNGTGTSPGNQGGTLFVVGCGQGFLGSVASVHCNATAPIYDPFNIISVALGGASHNMLLSVDPNTGIWSIGQGNSLEIDNALTANVVNTPTFNILNISDHPGVVFENATVSNKIQIVECWAGADGVANGHLCLGDIAGPLQNVGGAYTADGVLEGQSFISNSSMQTNDLYVGLNTPINTASIDFTSVPTGTYQQSYFFSAKAGLSESIWGFPSFGAFTVDPATYSSTQHPTITCPATQVGYPAGVIYKIYSFGTEGPVPSGVRGTGVVLLGTCTPGGTFSDDNTTPPVMIIPEDGTPVTDQVNGGMIQAGRYNASTDGTFGWYNNKLAHSKGGQTLDTAFSRDAQGVVDLGNGIAGDKSGTLNLSSINVGSINIDGKNPCLQDGTNCPSGSGGTAPRGTSSSLLISAHTCTTASLTVSGLVAGQGLSAAATSNPGVGVIGSAYYISNDNAGLSVCNVGPNASNSVTWIVTAN